MRFENGLGYRGTLLHTFVPNDSRYAVVCKVSIPIGNPIPFRLVHVDAIGLAFEQG